MPVYSSMKASARSCRSKMASLLRATFAASFAGVLALDPDRLAARVFRGKFEEAGYQVSAELIRAGEPGGERVKGTLYRIRVA